MSLYDNTIPALLARALIKSACLCLVMASASFLLYVCIPIAVPAVILVLLAAVGLDVISIHGKVVKR